MTDAINQFKDAQEAIQSENFDAQLSVLDEQAAAAKSLFDAEMDQLDLQIEAAEMQLQQQIDWAESEFMQLDSILISSQEQINALLGIDNSIMSVSDAVTSLDSVISSIPIAIINAFENNKMRVIEQPEAKSKEDKDLEKNQSRRSLVIQAEMLRIERRREAREVNAS